MVIESETALALSLKVTSLAANVAPVVVTEQQRHVVGHGESRIVVTLHLGKDGPQLRYGIGTSIDVLDDLALSFNHLAERLHVFCIIALAHRHVTVTPHADGDEIVVGLVAFHALAEELVDALLVRGIVPWSDSILPMKVLLVRPHHGFMVRGSHHDAHLIGEPWTLGVVFIEGCRPHGRPEIVGLQTQQQFKDVLVCLGVDPAEMVGAPCAERWPFVIDEDATVFHLRRRLNDASSVIIHFVLMLDGRIGHPIPGRHAYAFGYLINTIDGAPLVASSDDQFAIDNVYQI